MEPRPIAYQIYSARDEAEENLELVFAALKDMGYDGVEFAGFYGHSADHIASLLAKYDLQPISSHVPVQSIEADMFGVLSYHQRIGCRYIAVPFLDESHRPGAPGFSRMLRLIYRFGALCREAGIQLLYHNHDFEFVDVSGEYGLDFLYSAVPPDILQTEIDTCWVKYAGVDPAAYLRKYAGRSPVVHLKDFVGSKGEASPYALLGQAETETKPGTAFSFRPFGHGCQDAEAVVAAGLESGAQWFVVEQDLSLERPPLEAARMSIETLRRIGVKK